MNAQTTNQNQPQATIEQRIRTMRILWTAMLMSVVMYYVFTIVSGRREDTTPNPKLSLILLSVALLTTLISIPIKSSLVSRAVEQQQTGMVQQGYVVAWAVNEVAALLGLFDFFITGDRYYYLLMIVAACGLLLHFPRRQHVLNAVKSVGSFGQV